MTDPVLWLALRNSAANRRREVSALLERGLTPAAVFRLSFSELAAQSSLELARRLSLGPDLQAARSELSRARDLGVRLLTPDDSGFPLRLRSIPDPPLVLYLRGELASGTALAVVGGRHPSASARNAARAACASCAGSGVSIVSGLAYGIDGAAHRGALDSVGRTLAVLASGVDKPSPAEHRGLAKKILEQGGALLSEQPCGKPALPHAFPERNRLISGLADLVWVVEAREASGSLWTARHALEQGRELAASPAALDRASGRGSNRLIQEGAHVILDAADLLELLQVAPTATSTAARPPGLSALSLDAASVWSRLDEGPQTPDELAESLQWSPGRIAAALTELELEALIRVQSGSAHRP